MDSGYCGNSNDMNVLVSHDKQVMRMGIRNLILANESSLNVKFSISETDWGSSDFNSKITTTPYCLVFVDISNLETDTVAHKISCLKKVLRTTSRAEQCIIGIVDKDRILSDQHQNLVQEGVVDTLLLDDFDDSDIALVITFYRQIIWKFQHVKNHLLVRSFFGKALINETLVRHDLEIDINKIFLSEDRIEKTSINRASSIFPLITLIAGVLVLILIIVMNMYLANNLQNPSLTFISASIIAGLCFVLGLFILHHLSMQRRISSSDTATIFQTIFSKIPSSNNNSIGDQKK